MKKIAQYLKLIRPHQYIKNLFVYTPLFFAGQFSQTNLLIDATVGFVAFSLIASSIYILNDYRDIAVDRLHPSKKNRPLASGAIKPNNALFLMIVLLLSGIGMLAFYSPKTLILLIVYLLLNVGYSLWLKRIAILDVTIIAVGFVLRIFVGSFITGIPLSEWIVIMTFLLALFLALAKRRDDVLIFLNTNQKMRQVISDYNLKFIEGAMMIMASVTIVAYILYTTSQEVVMRIESNYIYLTSLYVILGILRYMQITLVENKSGSPTRVAIKDVFLRMTILAWVLHFALLLYL